MPIIQELSKNNLEILLLFFVLYNFQEIAPLYPVLVSQPEIFHPSCCEQKLFGKTSPNFQNSLHMGKGSCSLPDHIRIHPCKKCSCDESHAKSKSKQAGAEPCQGQYKLVLV